MNQKFNWASFPKFIINVDTLAQPSDICQYFEKNQVDKYVYCIMHKGTVLKFGMSAAEGAGRIWGERVYRQIGHCGTWPQDMRINGKNGEDWLIVERDYVQLYNSAIELKYLKVIVWDVTHYNFLTFKPFDEVEKMESELIKNYEEQFGEKPIGNLRNNTNNSKRSFIEIKLAHHLFDNAESIFGNKHSLANQGLSPRRGPSKAFDHTNDFYNHFSIVTNSPNK